MVSDKIVLSDTSNRCKKDQYILDCYFYNNPNEIILIWLQYKDEIIKEKKQWRKKSLFWEQVMLEF